MTSTQTSDDGQARLEELRTNARLLALIYDNTSDPVYLVRVAAPGRYVFVSVNDTFLRVTGYELAQVIHQPMERVIPRANIELVRAQYSLAIRTREPVRYDEQADLPAGKRYAEITLIPIFADRGEVTHILGDIHDVTARRIAEMERERLWSHVGFLLDASRLLASLDVEHALSDLARLVVTYLGDGCAIDLFGEGGPRRVVAIARDANNPMFVEVHPTVLGGNALTYRLGDVHCLGAPLRIKGRTVGAITIRGGEGRTYAGIDLQLAEELGRRVVMTIDNAWAYQRAQEALQARDDFLAIAAHEIRGPVTSLHLAVQALLQKRNVDASRLLELIEREDRRLSRFVDELLDLDRLRSGQLQLRLREVDLTETVRDVVRRLGPELTASGSAITVAPEPDIVGEWDRFGLEQIVSNLLSNAIKFGLGKPIEVRVSKFDGRARIVVHDEGIGIDASALARIFEPFERNVSVRHYGGLGLGLYIVKTLVAAMKGAVRVESSLGAGSSFIVELPLRITPEADHARPRRG